MVVIDVFDSFPVSELSPRNEVKTRINVRAIYEELPAILAAFL